MLLASVGLVALLVMAVQPTYSMLHVDLEVRKLEGGGAVEIGYSVGSSPHRYEMIISVMPVDELKDVPDILIVGAGGRPEWSSAVTGLYDHITAELKIRGIAASVEMVDIGDLGSEMDTNDVIIIAEAVDMDEEAAADLMAWVMDGGRLICVGPSSLPFCQKLVDKRWTGPDDFLRVKYQRLNSYRMDAVEASTYAQALSLRTSAPVWALEKRYLDDLGASTIGYLHHDEDGDLVTSAMVPLGEGRLILFGGPSLSHRSWRGTLRSHGTSFNSSSAVPSGPPQSRSSRPSHLARTPVLARSYHPWMAILSCWPTHRNPTFPSTGVRWSPHLDPESGRQVFGPADR